MRIFFANALDRLSHIGRHGVEEIAADIESPFTSPSPEKERVAEARFASRLATLLLVLPVAFSIVLFILYAWFELNGAFNGDSRIYWTMGRGIVNGYLPYADLFDNKPPGIFLLSAVSFWLTDSTLLCHILQTITVLLLPVGMFGLLLKQKLRPDSRWLAVAIGTVFTMIVALYMAKVAGTFQTESFGVFFSLLYIITIAWNRDRPLTWPLIGLATIWLFIASFFKEPFIISNMSAALLLTASARDFWRRFVVPALFASLVGLVALALSGYLVPYITLYVPFQLHSEMPQYGTLLNRLFHFDLIGQHLWNFSPPFIFALIALYVGTVVITAYPFHVSSRREFWIRLVFLLTGIVALGVVYFPLRRQLLPAYFPSGILDQRLPFDFWQLAFLSPFIYWIFYNLYKLLRLLPSLRERKMFAWSQLGLLSLPFLVTFVVGLHGSFKDHHVLFAAPIALALLLVFARHMRIAAASPLPLVSALLLAGILAVVPFVPSVPDYHALLSHWKNQRAQGEREAAILDAVMDRCGVERYLVAGDGVEASGFARHSPFGPPISTSMGFLRMPMMSEAFLLNLQRADIITHGENFDHWLVPEAQSYVQKQFTGDPWPCARGIPMPETFRVLYRKTTAR